MPKPARKSAPRETPIPMPAFAPVERPLCSCTEVGVSGGAVADEDVCVPDASVLDNAVECPVVVVIFV